MGQKYHIALIYWIDYFIRENPVATKQLTNMT